MPGAIDRLPDLGSRLVTPVDVSLCTTSTALIRWSRSSRSFASTIAGSTPRVQSRVDELDVEADPSGQLGPEPRELADSRTTAPGRRATAC